MKKKKDSGKTNAVTIQKAIDTQHMHWINLQYYIQQYPQTLFLLTHFSLRYDSYHIRQFFIKTNLINVHPILVESDIYYHWTKRKMKQQQQQQQQQQHEDCNEGGGSSNNDNENLNQSSPPTCICFLCNPP
jgi:hypothetical protein